MTNLIASAPTQERLLKLTRDYFFNPLITFSGEQVLKSNGQAIEGVRVAVKKNRYRLERVEP